MDAISTWQPHATRIAMKWKTIETRTHDRFARLKGQRVAIHASKRYDMGVPLFPGSRTKNRTALDIINLLNWVTRSMGHIVCTALVTEAEWEPILALRYSLDVRTLWNVHACCSVHEKFLLFLEDIRPLSSPIPFRGKQGIFHVHDELLVPMSNRSAQRLMESRTWGN